MLILQPTFAAIRAASNRASGFNPSRSISNIDLGLSAFATSLIRSVLTTSAPATGNGAARLSASPQQASAGIIKVAVRPSEPCEGESDFANAFMPSPARLVAVESVLIQLETLLASVSISDVSGASRGTW